MRRLTPKDLYRLMRKMPKGSFFIVLEDEVDRECAMNLRDKINAKFTISELRGGAYKVTKLL